MTDATAILPPGFRVTDANGAPVSGAMLKFYDAGTTDPKTVYSNSALTTSLGAVVYTDSAGTPVASSGSATAVMVYTGIAAYKLIVTDADDVTLLTLDNIKGAIDTSTFLTVGSTSTLSIPVTSKTANYTLVAADRSKLVQGNTTGGNFTLTLDSAVTLGDGWSCEIRNSGTAGQLLLAASEAISFEGGSFTARAFEIGEAATIRCDGTAFKIVSHTPPLMAARGPGVIAIADRITASPVSPTPGARYIVTTGFSTYATHDIIEANGSSFNKYTPTADCGWVAYVQDEDVYYSFKGTAWAVGVDATATDTVPGILKVSTQALMETGTATDAAVLIGHQHYHPGHPKFWARVNVSAGAPTLATSYNVTSITDTAQGRLTVTIATDFANANWCAALAIETASGDTYYSTITNGAVAAGTIEVRALDTTDDS